MLNMSVVCERSKNRLVVGWVTAFAVTLIATLGAPSVTSAQDIWRSTNGVVKIVDAEKTSSNQHPISFSEGDVYFALRAIKVQKKGGFSFVSKVRGNQRATSLFLDDDARLLAPFLAAGLRQAGANRDIFFSLKSTRGGGAQQFLASSSVVTSGRAFYRGNRLNFIFGSALNDAKRATGEIDSNANRFGIRKTRRTSQGRIGSRKSKSRIGVEILASDSVKLARLNGKVRNDWVVVGLDSAVRAGSGQIRGAQQQPVANAPASAGSAPVRSNRSAEDQLARLKSLRDKGLVTEEAYQAQILKILDKSL